MAAYLEFRIPEAEKVILDFNKDYNPYGSDSPNYSCPIPPVANHVKVAIPAQGKKIQKEGALPDETLQECLLVSGD